MSAVQVEAKGTSDATEVNLQVAEDRAAEDKCLKCFVFELSDSRC